MTEPGGRAVVALDLGGTAMKGALAGASGELLVARTEPTHAGEGPDAVVERAAAVLAELAGGAEARGTTVVAAGVAVPGIVDEERGVGVFSANLHWREMPLRERLEDALGLRVAVTHDVRAAGAAEASAGAASGADDFLYLAIGTGIAGALRIDGRPATGAHGAAGELGHLPVPGRETPCGCGNVGCLETVASAAAIARRYQDAGGEGADGGSTPDAAAVLARALDGDPVAQHVRDEAIEALAWCLSSFQLVVDTELVVLGGGLALAGEAIAGPLREATERRCVLAAPPRLVVGALGTMAGCIGAALAAFELAGRLA